MSRCKVFNTRRFVAARTKSQVKLSIQCLSLSFLNLRGPSKNTHPAGNHQDGGGPGHSACLCPGKEERAPLGPRGCGLTKPHPAAAGPVCLAELAVDHGGCAFEGTLPWGTHAEVFMSRILPTHGAFWAWDNTAYHAGQQGRKTDPGSQSRLFIPLV